MKVLFDGKKTSTENVETRSPLIQGTTSHTSTNRCPHLGTHKLRVTPGPTPYISYLTDEV
jgi:hypothetical protein